MKEGLFVKYMGKEFAASNDLGDLRLFSDNLADIEKYGFEKRDPYDLYGYGRVVCKKDVHLSEVDEYYTIGLKAIYKGYKGGIGRPNKDNMVNIGFNWGDMTREEAKRLGMTIEHGAYSKYVPMDELEIFEERQDWDIPSMLSRYEKIKDKYNDKDEDLMGRIK